MRIFKVTTSQSPGNIFLFGEHAVVYSKPAIVASVNLQTKCQIAKIADRHILISSREFGGAVLKEKKEGNKDLFVLLDLCEGLLNEYKIKSGLEIKIESDIPPESGLSSSTAVLCSLLSSFSKLFEINIPKDDYYHHLIEFQKIIHGGKASGSEIISSSMGGFNYISFINGNVRVKKLDKLPLKVVIGDTGIRIKTSKTVKGHIPDLMERNPKLVRESFDKIETICKEGLLVIKNKDILRIGELMSENQEVLASLGLSHPKIDLAVEKALRAGAYGAKLSGKGQGGIMFALTNDGNQHRVAGAIREAGLEIIETEVGVEGVK